MTNYGKEQPGLPFSHSTNLTQPLSYTLSRSSLSLSCTEFLLHPHLATACSLVLHCPLTFLLHAVSTTACPVHSSQTSRPSTIISLPPSACTLCPVVPTICSLPISCLHHSCLHLIPTACSTPPAVLPTATLLINTTTLVPPTFLICFSSNTTTGRYQPTTAPLCPCPDTAGPPLHTQLWSSTLQPSLPLPLSLASQAASPAALLCNSPPCIQPVTFTPLPPLSRSTPSHVSLPAAPCIVTCV